MIREHLQREGVIADWKRLPVPETVVAVICHMLGCPE